MPVLQKDEDWSAKSKRKNSKNSKKNDSLQTEIDKKKTKVKSLFETFKLQDVLEEIENAEKEKDFEQNINFSSKLQILMDLMKDFRKEGHRLLVFSMSKKVLTIVEEIIGSGYLGKDHLGRDLKYIRIDGNTEISTREQMCIDFNNDPTVFCALLTTKVGG